MQSKSRVIPCEITHSKNESLPIVFILSTSQYICFITWIINFSFFSKYVTRAIPNFLTQSSYSRCMPSGSYSKISSLAQLHGIVKFQKHWKKAEGVFNKKIFINKKCPIEVGRFLLIYEICTSSYSGTRSHWRLILRIMYSFRTYTSILQRENNLIFFAKNCAVSGGMALQGKANMNTNQKKGTF